MQGPAEPIELRGQASVTEYPYSDNITDLAESYSIPYRLIWHDVDSDAFCTEEANGVCGRFRDPQPRNPAWWGWKQMGSRLVWVVLYSRDKKSLLTILSTLELDVSFIMRNDSAMEAYRRAAVREITGSTEEYDLIGTTGAGVVSWGTTPHRFLLETPSHVGSRCFFVASVLHGHDEPSCQALCICETNSIFVKERKVDGNVPKAWTGTGIAILRPLLDILRHYVNSTTRELSLLRATVTTVEETVMSTAGKDLDDLDYLVKALHSCNSRLIKLERRYHFQTRFVAAVDECLVKFKTTSSPEGVDHGQTDNQDSETANRAFSALQNALALQARSHSMMQYDIEILPRRIANQYTAMYNLIAQRDATASMMLARESGEIAKQSHKAAEAALRESSSMKTIAVLTLIFLPPTFTCSFFSMTFFNWNADADQPRVTMLWLYFAVTIPLTVLVVILWLLFTKSTRESIATSLGRRHRPGRDIEKTE